MKLAKWEDRGHYAQKQETEKSQRQLHKLARDAKDALSKPVAGVLATAAAAGGFADLADPDLDAYGSEATAKKKKLPPPPPPGWQEQVCPKYKLQLLIFVCQPRMSSSQFANVAIWRNVCTTDALHVASAKLQKLFLRH